MGAYGSSKYKNTERLKVKGLEKIYHTSTSQKKVDITIQITK